jgi:hypothetical protein
MKVKTYKTPKGPFQCRLWQCLRHRQRNSGYTPRCVACGDVLLTGTCATSKKQLKCCSCRGNHAATYRGCSKWKEATADDAKHTQGERGQKDGVYTRLTTKTAPPRPSTEEEKVDPGWNNVVRSGRVVNAQSTNEPTPIRAVQAGGQQKPGVNGGSSNTVPQALWLTSPPPATVSLRWRGSPMSSTNSPPPPAYSWSFFSPPNKDGSAASPP